MDGIYDYAEDVKERLKQKDQQIAELKQQLEEKGEMFLALQKQCANDIKKLKRLKEIRFNGFIVDCNFDEARDNLQREILKMQKENEELRKSQDLKTYAENILKIKDLENQLHTQPKEIVEKIKKVMNEYFYTTTENEMVVLGVPDFKDALDEILKDYGGE